MLMPSIFSDNVFDDFMNFPSFGASGRSAAMKTDIREYDDHFELDVDLPGVKKEDVTCELKDGYLNITANSSYNNDEKDDDGKYIRRERYTGTTSRSFYVGDTLSEDDIKAHFEDGILKLFVPKEDAKKVEDQHHFVSIE